jgi:hypothetical protein
MNGEVAAAPEQTPVREGQLRAPWRWEQVLVDSAVIGSRGRWRRRLDGVANELRAKLAELSDDDEIEAAAIRRLSTIFCFHRLRPAPIDPRCLVRSAIVRLGQLGDLPPEPSSVLIAYCSARRLAPIAPSGRFQNEVVDPRPPAPARAVPPPHTVTASSSSASRGRPR